MAIPITVRDFLRSRNVDFDVIIHPTAFTAQEEAAVTHIPGREWAKTVVCIAGDDQPVLAVLPAHYTVDLDRLRALADAQTLRLATEKEIVKLYPGCEAGAMPPLGPLYGHPVFVDDSLAAETEVVFNAGTHVDAIRMRYDSLLALSGAKVGSFGRAPGAAHEHNKAGHIHEP